MGKRRYIDFSLMEKYPNKYGLTPKSIKKLKVADWEKLKKITWFNEARKSPCWCHLEGSDQKGYWGDSEDEFWIGFYEDGRVDCHFSSREGMCRYAIEEFYKIEDIENEADMDIQAKTIRWINKLLDDGILER